MPMKVFGTAFFEKDVKRFKPTYLIRMDAKAKLKQQLQAKRLKRGGPQAQRTFLEKQKVPEELIDSCMNRMKGGSNNIQSLMNQMNQMNQLKQMTAAVTAASANASATTSTTSANASATVEDSASATAFASAVASASSNTIPDTPSPSPIVTNTEPQPASELKLD
jgi:hypothetical protein